MAYTTMCECIGQEEQSKKCVVTGHLQHEVLLPAWLGTTYSDGGALDVLHFQRHVGVKFLCGTMRNISVTIKQTSV